LQVSISFWSDEKGGVVTQHLETFFIGHATAQIIADHLLRAIDNANLLKKNLVAVASDGPNVNKKVWKLINEEVKTVRGVGLVDIGTCSLHIVHNAFLKGLDKLGEKSSELVLLVYHFFDGWPSRWEDFEEIQGKKKVPKHRFIKHASTRWLTILPALLRLLEQWDALKEYFLKHIPNQEKRLMALAKYSRIVALLRDPTIMAEIHFVISVGQVFTDFSKTFQKEEPLIHLLYDELNNLAKVLMNRFIKSEVMAKEENFKEETLDNPNNFVSREKIVLGDDVHNHIQKLNEGQKQAFISSVRNHYVAAVRHLFQKSLSFHKKSVIRHLNFLQLSELNSSCSCDNVSSVAKVLPVECRLDTLADEWKLLQQSSVSGNERAAASASSPRRIDEEWNAVVSEKNVLGSPKYPVLSGIVKTSLILAHGSADVERRFSRSRRVLTEDRACMSERTLNGRLNVIDGMARYKNRAELVPITKRLLALARNAWNSYERYLEDERKKKEELKQREEDEAEHREAERKKKECLQNKKQRIDQLENELDEKKQMAKSKGEIADSLLKEASDRLLSAVKKGDLQKIELAQSMLTTAMGKHQEEREIAENVEKIQKNVEKRKSAMISDFFGKKSKH
jgi:hypothetical protein